MLAPSRSPPVAFPGSPVMETAARGRNHVRDDVVDIEAPPERVWPYLVEPDLCMQWSPMVKRYEFAARSARQTGGRILADLKRLAESPD